MSNTDLRTGVDALYNALVSQSTPEITERSLTGNHLKGGTYTDFASTGIKDNASSVVLTVKDDGIVTPTIQTQRMLGNVTFDGSVNIKGGLFWDNTQFRTDIIAEATAAAAAIIPKIDYTSIPIGGLKGEHIRGGTIAGFNSQGITDKATKKALIVSNEGIETDRIKTRVLETDNLVMDDATFAGDLTITGTFTAERMHVNEITSDNRIERSEPLQFHAPKGGNIYNQGLLWVNPGEATKQFVLHNNPDQYYSSENINIHRDKEYLIGGLPMLNKEKIGDSIHTSKLKRVGRLQGLQVDGNFELDQFMFYSSVSNRLGFGVEEPNGTIGIASLDNDFIIDVEDTSSKIGNFSSTPLNIVTDNVPRIQISATGNNIVIGSNVEAKTNIQGKLGINVNSPDADIVTAGPVKFEGKKFSVGEKAPKNGVWNKGDIVWNQNPAPTSYVGWICVRSGNPGEWKTFGQIHK